MLWPLDAATLATLVGGALTGAPSAVARRVITDSRGGIRAGDLFVGLRGPHFDGGRYAADALAGGAAIALVAHGSAPLPADGAVVAVDDPLAALQALAAEARRRFGGVVVAVTGSNGKTMVKDMLARALGEERRVCASPMSYNSQVGVALALLGLDPAAEVAVVECGISLPGEMARLHAMVRPALGILTNIGDAHLEGLGSRERTAAEKAELFRGAREVFALEGQATGIAALEAVGAPVTVVRRDATLPLDAHADFLHDDAALAAACARALGASEAGIARGLTGWRPPPMRLEMSTTPRGVFVLNDAYTADPESVSAALRLLAAEKTAGRAIAVLGGMAQLGVARRAAHARVGEQVVSLGIDRLVGVGEGGAEICASALAAGMAPHAVSAVPDAAGAAAVLDARPGDRVLLKGSRPERLERLLSTLFESMAPARLYVDLDRVVANYRGVKRAVGEAGVMAVVKAFGYGLDAVRVAQALERAGVEHFAVAYADEGVDLRDHGVTRPILVQNVLAHEVDKIVRHALSAEVADPDQVAWLADEAQRQQRTVRVHVKVDTGMSRVGCRPEDAVALAGAVAASPWLALDGLMTHFASADDPAEDDFTREQLRRFEGALGAVRRAGLAPRWAHACNSAGITRFPEAHHDMVRVGLGLFGYSDVEERLPLGQQPVLRLVTQVVTVKELPAGATVGYGRTFTTPSARRAAVVALGYSDGYPWSLSNRGWMAINGARCPVIGRVCMDVTVLDVTGVDCAPGDEVVVFGPEPGEPSVQELAALAGTIPYELLTRISARVRRVFRSSL